MVRRNDERKVTDRPEMYDGEGVVVMKDIAASPEELNGKARLYATLTIPVGGSIGAHVHQGESEIFYVLSGTGEFDDSGTKVPCAPGDVLLTAVDNGHALRNTGSEPLVVVALVIYG